MIPHNKPYVSDKATYKIKEVISTGWINYGKVSNIVENKLSTLILNQNNSCTLVTNGTSALYLALLALNIKKDDEIIIPTYGCTALLNAVNLVGAKPIIADISKKNLSFTKKILKKYITKQTKAIIVVHTFGIACEIDEIAQYNIPIIEDCAQSLGTKFNDGSYTGSKGDISIFSFYATKTITGGLGGAIVSRKRCINEFIKDYVNFDVPLKYKTRFNFQISDINAAIILLGLDELNSIINKKRKIAEEYLKVVDSKYSNTTTNQFRFLIEFKRKKELLKIKKFLELKGIKTIIPIENFELLHNYLSLNKSYFKNAEYMSKHILSIPIYPSLKAKEIEYIKRSLYDYFSTSTSI